MKALEREPDDRMLIEAAQRERSHFAELYEQNFNRVYAFMARRAANREEAQDLTAEVFHQALASLDGFKWQGAPFISWLYGIAANVLAAHWHKTGRNPEQLAEDWGQGGADEIERRAVLAELVESLLPDQQTVIVRRFIEQRSIREVAQDLGVARVRSSSFNSARSKISARNWEGRHEPTSDGRRARSASRNAVAAQAQREPGSGTFIGACLEVRMLPSPGFRSWLKDQLIEGSIANGSGASGRSASVVGTQTEVANFERAQGLAGIAPLLSGKGHGLFPADHRSFLVSFASHAALIALIASGIFVGRVTVVRPTSLTSELTYPLTGGGGGSGERSAVQASKGTPKFSDQQLAPPVIVVRNGEPKMTVDANVVAPPDVKLPQSNHIGDLVSSNIVMPSNGTGAGGAAGDGSGNGMGKGNGAGYGSGFDRGIGGGPFSRTGLTAPRAIYDPEPEYSDEARRVKHQGVVVLSLVVDPQGQARNIRVARSLGMGLDEKAIEAVKKWRFAPGTKDGTPVAVQVNVEVNFRLY